jgi:Rer1 family
MKTQHLIQTYIDKSVMYRQERWIVLAAMLLLYVVKILRTGSHYLITYCLFLYLLHGFIGFCTPIDSDIPDPLDIEEADSVHVPEDHIKRSADESKPFMRRLPEFEYWYLSIRAISASLLASLFDVFNIPVYTPILVVYFVILVWLTAIKIRKHMEKYRYNPFTSAKKIYRSVME